MDILAQAQIHMILSTPSGAGQNQRWVGEDHFLALSLLWAMRHTVEAKLCECGVASRSVPQCWPSPCCVEWHAFLIQWQLYCPCCGRNTCNYGCTFWRWEPQEGHLPLSGVSVKLPCVWSTSKHRGHPQNGWWVGKCILAGENSTMALDLKHSVLVVTWLLLNAVRMQPDYAVCLQRICLHKGEGAGASLCNNLWTGREKKNPREIEVKVPGGHFYSWQGNGGDGG